MSNLMQVIQSRRSTRAFQAELPPKEQIMQLVEAAEWAPSGVGKYLWHFTVVYSAEESLRAQPAQSLRWTTAVRNTTFTALRSTSSSPISAASTTLSSTAPPPMENLLLMATELGLGSCWINQLRETCDIPSVRALLTEYGVPKDHIVICSAAVGYIAKETPAKPRREGTVSVYGIKGGAPVWTHRSQS